MNIDVSMRYSDASAEQLEGHTVIVIDVLRCTSVMIRALENGCERIIPVLQPEEAIALADTLGRRNCVLGGERGCNKLPGFDLGNSPLEYTPEIVGGKTVIMTTSNGTNAIKRAASGELVLIGALSNKLTVAMAAIKSGRDIHIICSGTSGKVSADDLVAAGGIIEAIQGFSGEAFLTDSAIVCTVMYDSFITGEFDLEGSYHCSRLISLGYSDDIDYCLTENTQYVVPYYKDGELLLYNS